MKKRAIIIPKNTKDNFCFADSIVASLHHYEIDHHPERISKLRPFINNYNWKDISFPVEQNHWKIFERNNKDIALNIFSANPTEKEINIIRRSEFNNKRKHIVDLLMITNNENNWHYVAIKNMSRLIGGVTSDNHGDFFCRNCMHSYRTKNALKKHERLCNNHNHCETIMPKPGKNILKFRSYDKSTHIPHIIYADLEAIKKEIQSCQPNPKDSYTEKKNAHIACSYALHMIRTYDENMISSYRGANSMSKFAKALKKW